MAVTSHNSFIFSCSDDQYILSDGQNTYPLRHILSIFPSARVYALDGPMGAGKTTFVRQLCYELGTEDVVNSPTFALVNVYEVPFDLGQCQEVYHFDCYRLRSLREAVDMGAEEYFYSGRYCFVEWPERIEALLPSDAVWVRIEVLPTGERRITLEQR